MKVDFYSVDNKGNHLYEGSTLNSKKLKLCSLLANYVLVVNKIRVNDIKSSKRNSIYFVTPLTLPSFKGVDIVRVYCNHSV